MANKKESDRLKEKAKKEAHWLSEINQQYQVYPLHDPSQIKAGISKIPAPLQLTIHQYATIYELPLDKTLSHLNSIGFRCNADDELKLPIKRILDGMYRNQIQNQSKAKSEEENAFGCERTRILLAKIESRREDKRIKAKEEGETKAEEERKALAEEEKITIAEAEAEEFKRLKKAEFEALKQRYKESIINFNFDSLYIIGEKEQTDDPNVASYNLTHCHLTELNEIYIDVWDNEEALLKWKNVNLVDNRGCK